MRQDRDASVSRGVSSAELDPSVATSGGSLLSVRQLSAAFQGVNALTAVQVDVAERELLGIIGANGAGKSTLLNAISGLLAGRASGEIFFRGSSILGLSTAATARAGIARSFQDPRLVDQLSVLENVMLGAHLLQGYGMPTQVLRWRKVGRVEAGNYELAHDIVQFVGLADVVHAGVASLPYGRRKLVDIARALMAGPKLLLLDEPSSGLDRSEQGKVVSVLKDIQESRRATVMFVEHHIELVRAAATSVAVLQAGQILAQGATDEILNSRTVMQSLAGSG